MDKNVVQCNRSMEVHLARSRQLKEDFLRSNNDHHILGFLALSPIEVQVCHKAHVNKIRHRILGIIPV